MGLRLQGWLSPEWIATTAWGRFRHFQDEHGPTARLEPLSWTEGLGLAMLGAQCQLPCHRWMPRWWVLHGETGTDSIFMAGLALLTQPCLVSSILGYSGMSSGLTGSCVWMSFMSPPLSSNLFAKGAGVIIPRGKINKREVQRA